MKRKAKDFDTTDNNSINTVVTKNIEKLTNNEKRKKVKFEKPLINKSRDSDENIKKTEIKKSLSKKTTKLNKNTTNTATKSFISKKDSKKEFLHNSEISKGSNHYSENEKPDWLKVRKEKKELKEKRKAKRLTDLYDIVTKAKQISEKLRRSDCTPQNRTNLIQKLHQLLQTHYNKLIFTHDISRIIQCMIKHCETDIRQAICYELKPCIILILQSKYAKNCIRSMLKFGSQEIRSDIISTFYGNIVKLMSHAVSSPLIELTYSSWCTDLDKIYFKQEFYGDIYKKTKDKTVKTLSDVFKTAEDMKSATLSAVKTNLIRILNKGLINSTLLHTVLLEYLSICSTEDKTEMIVMLRNNIVTLSQTKMGTRIAMQCIWHGTNKDRKIIMKTLKENVKTICISEHGYMILLALFDSVDDTVIMKKIILSELQKDLVDIALNEYGKHVILYLVARRNSHYFPPSIVQYLSQGDNNLISKKSADVREKELLEAISDVLIEAVTTDTAMWMSNSAIAMVTLAILKAGSGKKLNSAFESITKFLINMDAKIKEGNKEYSVIEHPGLHMMLKRIIQYDRELLQKNESTFGDILVAQLTVEILKKWIEFNRACFLLILLIENESTNIIHTLLSKLKPLAENLKSKKNPGASILLKKIIQE